MSTLLPKGPLARVLMLCFLIILLQIPAGMIGELRQAREASRDAATAEVSAHWGARQELLGPFLVVPYSVSGRDAKGEPAVSERGQLVFSPERLDIDAGAEVETRQRGLFRVPVYRARVRLKGRFRSPEVLAASIERAAEPRWAEARVVLRLSDVHAVDSVEPLKWDGREFPFEPGPGPLNGAGLQAPLPVLAADRAASFELALAFRGSGGIAFAPTAQQTVARLASPWADPSFRGAWLPAQREVGPQGFTSRWAVPDVARNLPAAWKHGTLDDARFAAALFGVDFLSPVDPYRMTERSLKYWPLFIGLAFLLVWLFEVVGGARVHPIQYLMIGMALCLFYLLELSLAEQFGFGVAYLVASAAVTVQVGLYSVSALQKRRALAVAATTVALYALLYLLLREDDYALLAGSLALFIVLSVVMFLTRRVRWDAPAGESSAAASPPAASGEPLAGQ